MYAPRRPERPGRQQPARLPGLKKAALVQHLAEASAEHRAAKGESPCLPLACSVSDRSPMYTVTVIAQKGGAGKTTLAINLSVAAEACGWRAALVDLDPQASAAGWGDHRKHQFPAVAAVPAARLEDALRTSRSLGARLAVIDTAPHSESSALAAARAADLALVPLRPAVLDLRALGATADICALAGARSAVVLNQAPPRGPLPAWAAEAVQERGLEVAPCRIGARAAFQHALTRGLGVLEHEPAGKAAAEVAALFGWVRQRLES